MRCPFCRTKVSKNIEMCPNCGQRIEVKACIVTPIGEISKSLLKKFGFGFLLFVSFIVGLFLHPNLWVGNTNIYNTYTLESVLQKGLVYLDEEMISLMIDCRDDLKTLLTTEGYENIKITEDINVDGYFYRGSSLTITCSNNQHDVKITYVNNQYGKITKTYAIAGSGESKDRKFEILEDDVKHIFEYLGFDKGFQLLADGYKQMEQIDNNKYQYIKYDDYNITLNNDIYNTIYKYSYIISK